MYPNLFPVEMSNISRQVFQKVVEENKRMKADLKIMCHSGDFLEWKTVMTKWKRSFDSEDELLRMLKESAGEILKESK
jgi:hypothetical protein